MKEIKFKAWDKKLKRMCQVIVIDFNFKEVIVYHKSEEEPSNWLSLNRFILFQYINLKDDNGKEIYEDDILKVKATLGNTLKGVVKFNEGEYVIELIRNRDLKYRLHEFYDTDREVIRPIEIIGNVFDTPELLEKD